MNFDRPPQVPQQPKYTSEQLQRYLQETNGALGVSLKVLVRGMEVSADPETYKPWPKAEVKKSLVSILNFFEVKVKYYEGAGESEKAKKAQEKVEELKNIFSAIDSSEEVSEGFLQTVQQAVESDINIPNNARNILDDKTPSENIGPVLKAILDRIPKDKLEVITKLIEKERLSNLRIEEIAKAIENLSKEFFARLDKLPEDFKQWEVEWKKLLAWRDQNQQQLYGEWDTILEEQKKDSETYLKAIEDAVASLNL